MRLGHYIGSNVLPVAMAMLLSPAERWYDFRVLGRFPLSSSARGEKYSATYGMFRLDSGRALPGAP